MGVSRNSTKTTIIMENLKRRIDKLIKYDCDNFYDLKESYAKISNCIYDSLAKIKETHTFSDVEIAELKDYAEKLLEERCDAAVEKILIELIKSQNSRKSFEF
jgi:hypothetical protein